MAHVPPVRAVGCSRCGDRPRVRRASGRKRRGDGSVRARSARSWAWADVVGDLGDLGDVDVGVGERAEATATAWSPDVFRPLAAKRAGSCVRGGGGGGRWTRRAGGIGTGRPDVERDAPARARGWSAVGERAVRELPELDAHPVRPLGSVTVRVGTIGHRGRRSGAVAGFRERAGSVVSDRSPAQESPARRGDRSGCERCATGTHGDRHAAGRHAAGQHVAGQHAAGRGAVAQCAGASAARRVAASASTLRRLQNANRTRDR